MGSAKVEKGERGDRKLKILLLLSAGFFFFMVLISFVREEGILNVWKLDKDLKELEAEVGHLKKENRKLTLEVRSLGKDASTMEKVAREELGLVKPGEVVYKLLSTEPQK